MDDYTQIDDNDLVQRICASNDAYLFGVLYDRYAGLVYNKCLGFVQDKKEAEDVTHDIFLKLFISLRKYSGRSKFSTWLYSFTYNFCVNYVQRNMAKRPKKTDLEDHENIEDYNDSDLIQLKADVLQAALNVVPAEDKMILLMKFQDDMSIADIMDALELGESAVKMRIKRAKSKVVNEYENLKKMEYGERI